MIAHAVYKTSHGTCSLYSIVTTRWGLDEDITYLSATGYKVHVIELVSDSDYVSHMLRINDNYKGGE